LTSGGGASTAPTTLILYEEAATIGIIGAADGPTAIYVSTVLAPSLMAPVAVAAYSYMSLVPILKPPVMRLLTTRAERRIKMPYTSRLVSRTTRILFFPIVATLVSALLVPLSAPLDRHVDAGQPVAGIRGGGPPL